MKLALSNLAWHPQEEGAVRAAMAERGVRGLEVAPTKVWPRPLAVSAQEVARYRRAWEDEGIRIVALQSLLFGYPDLVVFGSEAARMETLAYLTGMIRLARELGASVLVFGSPRNRATMGLSGELVAAIATDFFRCLAEAAWEAGVCFCVEPNPGVYGCDFITTAAEGQRWVERISHPGFGLHLDSGCLTLSHEPISQAIGSALPVLKHFHLSEPDLIELGTGGVAHEPVARSLTAGGYDSWRSIEMRAPLQGPSLDPLMRAVDFALATYA